LPVNQVVQFRPFIVGVCSTDPMVDYLPATVESLRSTVLKLGLLSEIEFSRWPIAAST
jgi:hypothetical protein